MNKASGERLMNDMVLLMYPMRSAGRMWLHGSGMMKYEKSLPQRAAFTSFNKALESLARPDTALMLTMEIARMLIFPLLATVGSWCSSR